MAPELWGQGTLAWKGLADVHGPGLLCPGDEGEAREGGRSDLPATERHSRVTQLLAVDAPPENTSWPRSPPRL